MPVTTHSNNIRLVAPTAAPAMPRPIPGQARLAIDSVLEYDVDGTSEFVFLIHAADIPGQTLIEESLLV